jgi:putative membrane protein
MPSVNAGLNALSALCLLAGWVAIRRGRVALHRALMTSAFASSALFLAGISPTTSLPNLDAGA